MTAIKIVDLKLVLTVWFLQNQDIYPFPIRFREFRSNFLHHSQQLGNEENKPLDPD
ncbi:hypothetical protein RUND412_011060, partial [Rhizina undulata]